MKSKILIDVDYDNQPIIKIEYCASDDVRDKLVKRFMDAFSGNSMFATFYFTDFQPMNHDRIAIVRPIPADLLTMNSQIMAQAAEHYERNYRDATGADDSGIRATQTATGISQEK